MGGASVVGSRSSVVGWGFSLRARGGGVVGLWRFARSLKRYSTHPGLAGNTRSQTNTPAARRLKVEDRPTTR